MTKSRGILTPKRRFTLNEDRYLRLVYPCFKVGKKAAGHTLDARVHDEFPEVT
jgi:hypothetical protein